MQNHNAGLAWRTAAFGRAKPNPACDEGFKGPLTEPQADGSSDRVLPLSLRDGPHSE